MVIRGLELKNFRRFRSVSIEFPENLIGIIGRNGAGKTTLVEAIAWGLYGNRALTGLGKGRQDKESLRSTAAAEGEPCSVELLFEVGGREYRLVREIRGKSAAVHAQIEADGGRVEADRDSGVTEFVERLIGLDAVSFRASVFARQRELAAFSGMRPEERKRTVNRLVGIDLIDRARARAREERRQKVAYAEGLEKSLEDLAELEELLEKVRARRKEAEEKIQAIEREVAGLEEEKEAAERRFESEREKQVAHLRAAGEVQRLQEAQSQLARRKQSLEADLARAQKAEEELRKLEPQLEPLQSLVQRKEELDRVAGERRRLDDLRTQVEARARELADKQALAEKLEREIDSLEQQIKKLEPVAAESDRLEEEMLKLEQKQRKLTSQLGGVEEKGKDLRNKRDQVRQLGPEGRCPTCRRPLEDHYERVLAELDTELNALRSTYQAARDELSQVEKRLADLGGQLKRAQEARQELSGLRSRKSGLQEQLATVRSDLERLEQEKERLEKALATVEALEYDEAEHQSVKTEVERLLKLQNQASALRSVAERLPGLREELAGLVQELEKTAEKLKTKRATLAEIGFDEKRFQQARDTLDDARRKLEEARDRLSGAKEELHKALGEMSQIRERIRRQKELREVLKKVRSEIADLDSLDGLFDSFRKDLGGRLRPLLEAHTSELVRRTTNGRYVLVELSSDYDLLLYDQNERYPLSRFSGGEQDLVNLCFRVAISRVVAERAARNPVNFIVLDEVFGSQDEERRGQILEALQGLSHHFRQIFLITHIEGVREMLPVVLEVREKSPTESTVAVL